jgi:hypothetical protein
LSIPLLKPADQRVGTSNVASTEVAEATLDIAPIAHGSTSRTPS